MHFLRSLASLLGRVFARLSQFLLAWARRGTEPSGPEWAEAVDDGPPEHWLRYLRERSPWLVRGNGPAPTRAQGTRPVMQPETRDVRRTTHIEGRGARGAARTVTRNAQRSAQALTPDAGRPTLEEPPNAVQSQPRASTVLVPSSSPVEPDREVGFERVPRPVSRVPSVVAPPAPVAIRQGNVPNDRVVSPASGDPLVAGSTPTLHTPQGIDLNEPVPQGASRVPLVVAPPPTIAIQQDHNPDDRAPRPATRASWSEGVPVRELHERAPRPAPGALESRDRWPDLPDVRWSEPTWEVPSSQTLVRLQQRLARLQAEQAGSSWSGRHS